MLKGFNYPLTPKGKSTLNPPALWYYSADFLDPARYQYREFFRLVDAQFEGKPIAYCPYIFVDNDAALARGWTQGYPKRIGQVFQTRYYAATGKAGPTLAPGSKSAGSLTASGRRLAQDMVTLKSYCLAHHVSVHKNERSLMIASIRYLDRFTKIDGVWYFAQRILLVDWIETREILAARACKSPSRSPYWNLLDP